MFNNPITTIPQVADMLRVKGEPKYKSYAPRLEKNEEYKSNPDNTDFWNGWMEAERQAVLNKVKNFNTAQKRLLMEKTQPPKNNNKSAQPFPTGSSCNSSVFSGSALNGGQGFGTANVTEGVKLSDVRLNEWRNMLIDNRIKEYNELGQSSFRPVDNKTGEQNNEDKLKDDLVLVGIEEKIFAEIADNGVYSALNNVISYYAQNIYKYDSTDYFVNLLERLNDLKVEVIKLVEYNEIENTTGRKEVNTNIEYAEVILDALDRLIQFLQANMDFVGNPESERLARQKATQKILTKKSNIIKDTIDKQINDFIEKYKLNEYTRDELKKILDYEQIPYSKNRPDKDYMRAIALYFIKNPDKISSFEEYT